MRVVVVRSLKMFTLIAGALALVACEQTGDSSSNSSAPTNSGSERLTWANEPVQFETANTAPGAVSAQAVVVNLNLSLLGTLAPPLVNGALVYATDVKFSGTKAYVAYNTPGPAYGGGIDVIDLGVLTLPILASQVQDPATDFSQLLVANGALYSAGAKDTGLSDSAIVSKYALGTSGNLVATAPLIDVLPGRVGTGVVADANNLYTASGDSGGLSILSPTSLSPSGGAALDGARDVRLTAAGKVAVLTAKTASADPVVKTYDVAGNLLSTSNTLVGAVINDGKSTLQSGSLFHLATVGVGGTKLICMSTGAVQAGIAIPALPGLTADQQAANAAAFANGLIYIANGGAGVYVYSVELNNPLVTDCNVTVRYQGRIPFADGTSVNNVMVSGANLIAATGAGGFKIFNIGLTVGAGLLQNL